MQLLRAKSVQHLLLSGQQTARDSVGGWHQQRENQRLSALARHEASDRLDSWKEIAVYLQREVRTVQRWEKREGLPVHRHIHVKAGTIYAFKREIDTWLQTRRPVARELAPKKEHLSGIESGKLRGAYEA